MRYARFNLLSFFVIILLLLQVKFFYLLPFEQFYNINSNQQQILMVIVSLVTILFTDLRPITKLKTNKFKLAILFFLIYYLLELVYSAIKNGQGILNAFVASNFYLMILTFFIFSYYIQEYGIRKFNNWVLVISLLNIIVCWLQFFLGSHGIFITKISTDSIRFGTIRISDMSETVTCLGILIASSRFAFIRGKNRWKYFLMMLLGIIGNLIVSKGRITIIALIVSMTVIFLIERRGKLLQILFFLLLSLVCIAGFFNTPIGRLYYSSLDSVETDTASIRQREYSYYNLQTKSSTSNFLFGVGFIRDNGDGMSVYMKGPTHDYSRSDIGINGIANAIGLIGAIWYIILLFRCGIYIYMSRKNVSKCTYSIIVSFFIFQLIYIPTMATLNPFSITSFTILLSFVNFIVGEDLNVKN